MATLTKSIFSLLLVLTLYSPLRAQFLNTEEDVSVINFGIRDFSGNLYYQSGDKILKVDSNNQSVQWAKKLNTYYPWDNKIVASGIANTYITLAEENANPFTTTVIRRTSVTGSLLWSKRISGNTAIRITASLFAKDNSIYLGTGNSTFHNGILKLNASGNLLWAKSYEKMSLAGHIISILEKKSGNLLVLAENAYTTIGYISIFEIDPSGNLLWSKVYQLPNSWISNIGSYVGKLTSKNEIIFSMNPNEQQPKPVLFKTDSLGNILWSQRNAFGLGLAGFVHALELDSKDRIITSNEYSKIGGYSCAFVRYNSNNGSLISGLSSDSLFFTHITSLSDNKFLLSGALAKGFRGILLKSDSTLSNICGRDTLLVNTYSYNLIPIQYTLTPYTFSITISTVVDTLTTASYSRKELCSSLHTGIISPEIESNAWRAFPNPVSDNLQIELTTPCRIKLCNTLLQVVFEKELEAGNHRLPITNLPPGLYVLSVTGNNTLEGSMKLLIN